MALRITEYASGGYPGLSGRGGFIIPTEPALATQILAVTQASTAASTAALGANTHLVRIESDIGCCVLFGTSASTTIASTLNGRIPPQVAPEYRFVNPYMRVTALST